MIGLVDVHKSFGNGYAALSGVSLEVARGEVFGIIGRSGAGKSTLIRLINGLERATSGRVLVDGLDVSALSGDGLRSVQRQIGMIFQHFGLLASRTVFDNVALPLRLSGERGNLDARVAALLDRVGLADQRERYPAQLSGGQKQRVGIARALATSPDILLCDEATSALDPETTHSILALISELNREMGLTIVLITHELAVVREICDRVAVMHAGRVVESGAVADVLLDPTASETRAMIVGETTHAAPELSGHVVQFTLRGAAVSQPVLTRVARDAGVDIAILDGGVEQFKDSRIARFTLKLSGGDAERALAALRDVGEVAA